MLAGSSVAEIFNFINLVDSTGKPFLDLVSIIHCGLRLHVAGRGRNIKHAKFTRLSPTSGELKLRGG